MGLFDNLFDFNRNGKLAPLEKAGLDPDEF